MKGLSLSFVMDNRRNFLQRGDDWYAQKIQDLAAKVGPEGSNSVRRIAGAALSDMGTKTGQAQSFGTEYLAMPLRYALPGSAATVGLIGLTDLLRQTMNDPQQQEAAILSLIDQLA